MQFHILQFEFYETFEIAINIAEILLVVRKEKTIPFSFKCLNMKTQQELLKKVKLQPNLYKEHKCKILNKNIRK